MCHAQYPMSNPSWELIECRPAHAFLRRIAIFVFWGGGFGADLVCNTLDCPMGCLRRDATQSLMEYQKRSHQQKSCLTSSQESVAFVTLICMIHNIHTILLYTQQQQQKKDLVLAEKLIITYNKQRSFSNQMQLTCCLHAVTIYWCDVNIPFTLEEGDVGARDFIAIGRFPSDTLWRFLQLQATHIRQITWDAGTFPGHAGVFRAPLISIWLLPLLALIVSRPVSLVIIRNLLITGLTRFILRGLYSWHTVGRLLGSLCFRDWSMKTIHVGFVYVFVLCKW